MQNLTQRLSLLLGATLLSTSMQITAAPRLADSFQYPIGGSTPGSVTPAEDQTDDFFNPLDFAENGTGDNADALHSGEDWRRNIVSNNVFASAAIIRASADGDIVAVSAADRTLLIRHQVPAGTLPNVPQSPRLAGAQEIYTLYRNVEPSIADVDTQAQSFLTPMAVSRGTVLGTIDLANAPELQFEMRTIEPDFENLYPNSIANDEFYADLGSLAADGLIDPSDFIDANRTIQIIPGPQLYIHDAGDTLAQVDVTTGSLIGLSDLGRNLTDIAFSPDGELFGLDFNTLYQIDLATGALREIGPHGISGGNALVFSAEGLLLGAGNSSNNLFAIDPLTGESTVIGATDFPSAGDLAFFQGELFLASSTSLGNQSDTLVRIQLEPEFVATAVGEIGFDSVFGLATASDGRLYATAGTQVLEIDPLTGAGTPVVDYAGQGLQESFGSSFFVEAGAAPTVLATSVLPTSRSVVTGTTATAFLSVINAGTEDGTNCVVAARSELSGQFEFQVTDPATNVPVGERNTPVDIPAGSVATFIVFLQSTEDRAAEEFEFNVGCGNTELAGATDGLNTLLFSSSPAEVPDMVALVATASNDGIIAIDMASGAGAFALASVNVGAGDDMRVTLDTGAANQLPVDLTLCETDSTGQCISGPPATAVLTNIAPDATPTFSVFVNADDMVPFQPELNRVFVRFRDSSGEIRGSTSVAVSAQ